MNQLKRKVLLKWLVIILTVITAFTCIMLYLGYLLKQNEIAVTALKQELLVQRQALANEQNNASAYLHITPSDNEQLTNTQVEQQNAERHLRSKLQIISAQQTIVEHLTCHSKQQCQLFDTGRVELGCVVAVNHIGLIELNKLDKFSRSQACEEQIAAMKATCRHNICSIE